MKEIEISELDFKRFNALAGHSRSPAVANISKELAWYSNEDESVIGVLLLDVVDMDFAAILMARDEGGRYRCFDLECSIATQEDAKDWLVRAMKWHTCQGLKMYPQDGSVGLNLFAPAIPPKKQHPYFARLANDSAFVPARAIINEMMPHFVDIDGNFVEQFQSTGFDARLWELYLNTYLVEEKLYINRTHNAPDFIVKKYGKTVAIEAVIIGRKKENPPKYFKHLQVPPTQEKIQDALIHDMPIRFGSSLYTKLQKEYWKLPHVQGNPLVFAIADFHDDQSMLWSHPSLIAYLYGVRHDFYYDVDNNLVITPKEIVRHKTGDKEIPSGFFFQPNSEYVSAVLSSSSGTISKFNRIGRQAGFCAPNVLMIRMGTCHDHNPNASMPRSFYYKVDENSEETWAEGLSMFHNPNAIHPVSQELFPTIAHHWFSNGQIVSQLPELHSYASVTLNLRIAGRDT